MFYRAYGLTLVSDRPIPALPPTEAARPVVEVCFGDGGPDFDPIGEPWYVSPYRAADGSPLVAAWRRPDGDLLFRYDDGTAFLIDPPAAEVRIAWRPPVTFEDAVSYLLGPMMGVILRLRGILCLHASGVNIRGGAVAFVGIAGAGKSTTAAAFAERGVPVLSDDLVPVTRQNGSWHAVPGYPRLRLWPSSVEAIANLSPDFPRLPADWGDRRYHVNFDRHGYRFQDSAVPLRAIYLLAPRTADAHAPIVSDVSPQTAMMALIANTFATRLLDMPMRAREFDSLSGVVQQIPIRQIRAHEDPARLPALCDAVLKDMEVGRAIAV